MIECICINDSARPSDIPISKWVTEGEVYHIIYATIVLPQGVLAFQIQEIDLDEKCYPYEYFSADRFAINIDDQQRLFKLVMDSAEANRMYDDFELMKISSAL